MLARALAILSERQQIVGWCRIPCWRALLLLVVCGATLVDGRATPARATANPCGSTFGSTDFRTGDPLVMTYLYYWYDASSLDDPALTLRPPANQPLDWSDPSWHRHQLADMAAVGVDVALAVYWGAGLEWSVRGLDALVAARESLLAEGRAAPAIGLFFDSNLYGSILADHGPLGDLTEDVGRDIFVGHLLQFFERVSPCHLARVDGRPLVFLWRPDVEGGGVLRFDQATIDAIYGRVERRVGARPYVVRERTWDTYARSDGVSLRTDGVFGWGAALKGPLFDRRVVAVGPGYDDRLVPGRIGYVREREHGQAYERDLRAAVLSGAQWLLLETWNELWEASAIGETAEHGREYLELTRRYVSIFRRLSSLPVRDGWVDLGTGEDFYLSWLAEAPEERGTPEVVEGRSGMRPFVDPEDTLGTVHFALRPRLQAPPSGEVSILVEYFDAGRGSFWLEYDSDDLAAPELGALKATTRVPFDGTNRWRVRAFNLTDASLGKRQYVGYGDFRLRDEAGEGEPTHVFGRVMVVVAPGARPILLGPENLSPLHARAEHFFELRWRGLAQATGYLVQLAPPDSEAHTPHGFSAADRSRCGGGAAWSDTGASIGPAQAVTVEERCLLGHLPSAPEGLYRWRVWALDAAGEPAWEPSDWGYLLAAS